jgi:metallo-beta-lactamase superfamily protein
MKLTVFQSDKGDCLLLTSKDNKRILIDGGMAPAYRTHVAPALGSLRENGDELDLVYVSHIDEDHVSGILQLMEDLVEWRVYNFQRASGNDRYPVPDDPRPPEVGELWHNAFHELAGDDADAIEDMLATTASVLEGATSDKRREEARRQRQIVSGAGEAIELTHRASPEQLGIPINKAFGGQLAMVRERPQEIKLGSLKITLLWPTEKELDDLRKEWNEWLATHQAQLKRIQDQMRDDAERLATGDVEAFRAAIALQAGELGDIDRVTAPNLASLMLFVEEGERTILLTGDGHADHILEGLELAGKIEDGGGLHVDVLKVQHHGSEYNFRPEFCRRITADDYVTCANGAYANPDPRVLEMILDSRLGTDSQRSVNPGAERPFKMWFNSSTAATPNATNKAHMAAVEKLIDGRSKSSGGRMTYAFLKAHSFDLSI